MGSKDPRIDTYIAKAAPFARPILKHIREVMHKGCPRVQETLKWSMPHFDYKGIMANMAAFKQHCAFGFWKGSLIFDGDTTAANEAMGHFGRITSLADLPSEKTLRSYIKKAMALNDAGVKSPERAKPRKTSTTLEVPEYFSAALSKNKKAHKTFADFSPSHRKEYIDWVTSAKREETRQSRLKTAIAWMAEGKSQNWRYERK